MEKRRLGRLGHLSSVLIYGGAALWSVHPDEADRSIALALEAGINHFDTAPSYGDSELHLGRWMSQVRTQVFLATKVDERDRDAARRQIHRSLERLRVESVDLLQLHAVNDRGVLEEVMAPGGALEALIEAREEGLTRGIGITGHGHQAPATHLEALRRFPFDTVLVPLNYRLWQDDAYRMDYERLAAEVRRQDAGLMVIKALAYRPWSAGEEQRYTTWYAPIDEQRAIDAAVAFVLRRPEVTGLATPGDVRLLPLLIAAERRASSVSDAQIHAVLDHLPEYESPFVTL